MFARIRLGPPAARAYFALQALAGAAWWVGVATTPVVRTSTLGDLPALPIAVADIPLFVIGSALVALGLRHAAGVVAGWTALVAAGMAVYATATGLAGWGALLMIAAAAGSIGAAIIVIVGRAPFEWIAQGPFAFRASRTRGKGRIALRTALQTLFFWGLFLGVLPALIALVEARWGLRLDLPLPARIVGTAALIAATALGVWSAVTMTSRGEGTPLPSEMARRLVIAGPYRYVRNPMAVAGIAQGVAVGLMLSSWLVVVYSLCGSLVWNTVVRPIEEADLAERFGDDYISYRRRVACWIPRLRGVIRTAERT